MNTSFLLQIEICSQGQVKNTSRPQNARSKFPLQRDHRKQIHCHIAAVVLGGIFRLPTVTGESPITRCFPGRHRTFATTATDVSGSTACPLAASVCQTRSSYEWILGECPPGPLVCFHRLFCFFACCPAKKCTVMKWVEFKKAKNTQNTVPVYRK